MKVTAYVTVWFDAVHYTLIIRVRDNTEQCVIDVMENRENQGIEKRFNFHDRTNFSVGFETWDD
jgi:hypothetical protein